MPHAHPMKSRRGLTLVELLVAISILAVLAAISIPAVQPLLEGRRVREGARAVDVYLNGCRIKTMQTGRPVGVLFERSENNPHASILLRQVAVPPPYAGDSEDALIQLTPHAIQPGVGQVDFDFVVGNPILWSRLVQAGDRIQLNYQGPRYDIAFPVPGVIRLGNDQRPGPEYMVGGPMGAYAFQVFRQPQPTATKPLQLNRGVAVDLGDSGSDMYPTGFAPSSPTDMSNVMILFAPNGSVQYVYAQDIRRRITEPLFLMVGLTTRAGAVAEEDGLENWEEFSNLWLTVQPQTGLATVAEVHRNPMGVRTKNAFDVPDDLYDSRGFARQSQTTKGGR